MRETSAQTHVAAAVLAVAAEWAPRSGEKGRADEWFTMDLGVDRSRTALKRRSLSRPISRAIEDGVIVGGRSVFDYGCGKGDDVALLTAKGIDALGWDPAFAPMVGKLPSDVVNLGYVVNVIEDPLERRACLLDAWSYATKVLIVAARLDGEVESESLTPFADGSLTRRGTFQKFFEQDELRTWIEGATNTQPIAAAPGVFYLFRRLEDREAFIASRYRRRMSAPRVRVSDRLYEQCRELLAPLETFYLHRGRLPTSAELPNTQEILARFGTIARAFRVIRTATGDDAWTTVVEARREDVLVYGAMSRFGGRPRWTDLPAETQHDVRAFYGTYKRLCEQGDELLYSVGQSETVESGMRMTPVGKLTPSALYVHISALGLLPPVLRVYEGCARSLSGSVAEANIIKLSRREPKVSYLAYPSFDKHPHPPLSHSVIVSPGRLRVNYRDYRATSNHPILHRKEEFVGEGYPNREKFARLTVKEEAAGLFAHPDTIGFEAGWAEALRDAGLELQGHRLVRRKD